MNLDRKCSCDRIVLEALHVPLLFYGMFMCAPLNFLFSGKALELKKCMFEWFL